MKYIFLFAVSILSFLLNNVFGQVKRVDTTLKIGAVGYRIICNNKDATMNELDIRPIGFDHDAHESRVYIKGRIIKAEIDDLNNDGFPDMMFYAYTVNEAKEWFITAYAIVSLSNKSFTIAGLPDVQLDAKYKDGYRGRDEFSLLEGTLIRKFPIYKPDDKDVPTGGKRILQYQLTGTDDTGFRFKVQQSFDTK
ncbi:MAG TPA: hypothetical protein VHZ50_16850 [Puia sp.]|nr:hypothetical protein [Puia sp.]